MKKFVCISEFGLIVEIQYKVMLTFIKEIVSNSGFQILFEETSKMFKFFLFKINYTKSGNNQRFSVQLQLYISEWIS